MQLADQAVAASGGSVESSVAGVGSNQRSSVTCRRQYAPVLVSGLDSGAVEDEDDQQQTEAPRKRCATVVEESKHAGQMC